MSLTTVTVSSGGTLDQGGQCGRMIARGDDGRIHAIYIEASKSDLQYRYSDDDGATWSAEEEIYNSGSYYIYTAHICVAANNEPVVSFCYYQATNAVIIFQRVAGSWTVMTSPYGAGTKLANDPGICRILYDPNSGEFVGLSVVQVGSTGYNIRFKTSSDLTGAWGSDITVESVGSSPLDVTAVSGVDACLDINGDVWVAALRNDGGSSKISVIKWTRSTTTLGSWDDVDTSLVAAGACSITMLVDKNGIPYVTACHRNGGARGVGVIYDKTSGSWSAAEEIISNGSYDTWTGRSSIADDGTICILCIERAFDISGDTFIRYRNAAGTWSTLYTTTDNRDAMGCCWCGACYYSRPASGYYTLVCDIVPDAIYVMYENTTVWAEGGLSVQASDTIEFSELAELYWVAANKIEGLEFSEVASEVAELGYAQGETVEFGELAGLTHEVEGEDEIEFGDSAHRNYEVVAVDGVEFTELATRLTFAEDTVEFGESGSAVLVVTAEATDGITFQEAAAHLPIEGCETDFVPTPSIPADPNTILYVYLQGPWATLAYTIRLTRPDYGDVRRNRLQIVVHRTRGGGRRVYKRTPSFKSLVMRFQGMSRKKLLELENFLENTAGEDIKFIDHNGHVWKGNLLNSPVDLSTEGRSQGEAMLEFEGEVISS